MVTVCEKFTKKRKLKFSTNVNPAKSKTKCVVFTKEKNLKDRLAPIILDGNPLPWVNSVNHLGHILESDNSMKSDCLAKRGKFIGKVHSLLQEFSYVDSAVMARILAIYVTSFYGSNLWNLYSYEVTKLFSSWNVTITSLIFYGLHIGFSLNKCLAPLTQRPCCAPGLLSSGRHSVVARRAVSGS